MTPEQSMKLVNMLKQAAEDHAMRTNPDADEITREMKAEAAKEVLALFMPMFALTSELMRIALAGSFEIAKKPALAEMPIDFAAGYTVAYSEVLEEMTEAGKSLPQHEHLLAVVSQIMLALNSGRLT
jgi:hypothetical protein